MTRPAHPFRPMVLALALMGCGGDDGDARENGGVAPVPVPTPSATATNTPPPAPVTTTAVTQTPVATFANPWAMTFLPDGRLLVTEKPGRLRLVTTAAAVAAAGRTGFHRAGFVDRQSAAVEGMTVQAFDGSLRFSVGAHFNETKALGAAGFTFHHDLGAGHGAEFAEGLLEVVVADGVGQVAYVEFLAHGGTPNSNQNNKAMESQNHN